MLTHLWNRLSAVLCCVVFFCSGLHYGSPELSAAETRVRIRCLTENETIVFAAKELARYLDAMAGEKGIGIVEHSENLPDKEPNFLIKLGLFPDFDIAYEGIEDPFFDDALVVQVSGSSGTIAGSNPRSVLFAVYRFLEANGCQWILPEEGGDVVPTRSVVDLNADIRDKAAYRFRGNNNCGSYTLDHLLAHIEWSPKVGLNTFFHEFMLPRQLFNSYYNADYPSLRQKEPRTDEEIRAYHELSIREIKKRGLLYHAVGHGWTGVVVGCPESESDHQARPTPDPDKVQFLAQVKGERTLKLGPTRTDICHGNPEARKRFADCVVAYAAEHPEVDYLHVWLDDVTNNTCDCEKCKGLFLSDSYVKLLNLIDAKLTQRGLSTRIVFLAYFETLWPPLKETFENQERFTLMYAPISRSYLEPYPLEIPRDIDTSPYELNKCVLPRDIAMNIAFLHQWQKVFTRRSSFVFDYHFVWHHYTDFGYFDFAKVLAEDIRRLAPLHLDGYVSCQNLRSTFPHGFPFWLHAKMLWNPNQEFDALADQYFEMAFGADYKKVETYVQSLSQNSLYTFSNIPKEQEEEALDKLNRAETIIQDFRPFIKQRLSGEPAIERTCWKYLDYHADITSALIDVLRTRTEQADSEKVRAARQKLVDVIAATEASTGNAFDPYWFYSRLSGLRAMSVSDRVSAR